MKTPASSRLAGVSARLRVAYGTILSAAIGAISFVAAMPASGTVLYDPAGSSSLPSLVGDNKSGDVSWFADSTVGQCYRFRVLDSSNSSERCELRASNTLSNNTTRYIGWRSRLVLTQPGTAWRNVFQSKTNASSSEGYLVIMRADGNTLRVVSYDGGENTVWSRALPLDTWFSLVLKIKYSTSSTDGEIQVWYNNSLQTLANGTTTWKARTWAGSSGSVQMGLYRTSRIEGTEYNYMLRPKVATSYGEAAPSTSSYVRIMNRNSGKALAVEGASMDDGAYVNQATYTDNEYRGDEWEVVDIGSGYCRIMNRRSGKALAVEGASTVDGAGIVQWIYTNNEYRGDEWQIVDIGSGYRRIVNRRSGKDLAVSSASTAEGARVLQWGYTSGAPTNDEWQIVTLP